MRQRLDLRIVRVVDSSDPTVLHLEMEFDPRRYKWLEHDGEMCLYDRLEKAVIPERVLHEIMGQYKVTREEIVRGVRGRENEARKVALYLIKRCCDRTLPEIAEYFGIGNYSTVSWSCRTVAAQMSREKNFRDRVERIIASIT